MEHPGLVAYEQLLNDEEDTLVRLKVIRRKLSRVRTQLIKEGLIVTQHSLRVSDSSFYDLVCTVCGATDASGDDRLRYECPGDENKGYLQALERKEAKLAQALDDLRRTIAFYKRQVEEKEKKNGTITA